MASGGAFLTLTDNRTLRSVQVPIEGNIVNATAIRQLNNGPAEPGLRLYDPGFVNTLVCKTQICSVDSTEAELRYRGYTLEDLVEHSTFLEVAFLLIHGDLPSKNQLESWTHRIMLHTHLHTDVLSQIQTLRSDAHPMGVFIATVAALSAHHPEANPAAVGPNLYKSIDVRDKQIYRLLGKIPSIAANVFRHRIGRPFNSPNSELGYTENLLYMMDKLSDVVYKPHPVLCKALDKLFIIQAEHGAATSTIGLRHLSSVGVDPYTAISGAAGCLFGERRSNIVIDMLSEIGSVDNVHEFVSKAREKPSILAGFGHAVYQRSDPRSALVKAILKEVSDLLGQDELTQIALALENSVAEDNEFVQRGIFPNVDFYTALVYHTLGFPTEIFSVLQTIPRVAGWLAHWQEQLDDADTRIYRPRLIYEGPPKRPYPELHLRMPAEVDLAGESIRSDPDAAKRRQTGATIN